MVIFWLKAIYQHIITKKKHDLIKLRNIQMNHILKVVIFFIKNMFLNKVEMKNI